MMDAKVAAVGSPYQENDHLLEAGVAAFLAKFRGPPPETREDLEEEIQWMDPAVQNPIAEALWRFSYAEFKQAVLARRQAARQEARQAIDKDRLE
jgi:hypothetical protein